MTTKLYVNNAAGNWQARLMLILSALVTTELLAIMLWAAALNLNPFLQLESLAVTCFIATLPGSGRPVVW